MPPKNKLASKKKLDSKKKLASKKIITTKGKTQKYQGEKRTLKRKLSWRVEDFDQRTESDSETESGGSQVAGYTKIKRPVLIDEVDLDTPLHMMVPSTYKRTSITETIVAAAASKVSKITDVEKQLQEDEAEIVTTSEINEDVVSSRCDTLDTPNTINNVEMTHDCEGRYTERETLLEEINQVGDNTAEMDECEETRHIVISQQRADDSFDEDVDVLDSIMNSQLTQASSRGSTTPYADNENIPSNHQTINSAPLNLDNRVNISSIIHYDNPYSEEVLTYFSINGTIGTKHRKIIVDVIIQYARVKNIFLSEPLIEDIAEQICELFPTESSKTYYVKINGKPSGKLYNAYHSKRGYDSSQKKQQKVQEVPEDISSEMEDSIAVLKNDGETVESYIENWKKTFTIRRKKMPLYETFDEFMDEWPIIAKPIGPYLIKMDFKELYGERSITEHNWNTFFSNNWDRLENKIKDKEAKTFCRIVGEMEDSPSKDAALSILLHYLLPPSYCAALWKPSIEDSQDTFLFYAKDQKIDDIIRNRNKVCDLRDIKWHPYIIGQGVSHVDMKYFYVVIHDLKIKVKNFVTAVDLCIKLYVLLNIPYPPESRAVWTLINKLFYDVKITSSMSSRIFEFIGDLN